VRALFSNTFVLSLLISVAGSDHSGLTVLTAVASVLSPVSKLIRRPCRNFPRLASLEPSCSTRLPSSRRPASQDGLWQGLTFQRHAKIILGVGSVGGNRVGMPSGACT
jgi:hypothetical protein